LGREFMNFFMKNIPQAYRPSYFWFWPLLILGGSVISAKWSFKTGDFLRDIQFIWNFLWQEKKKVTF
jgi:hypothetical protein